MKCYRSSFKKYLDDLGKRKPAPGGGSAVALIFCTGISLIEKAIRYSSLDKFKKQLEKLQILKKKIYLNIDKDSLIFAKIMSSKGTKRAQLVKQGESLIVDLGQTSLKVFSLAKEIESGIKKNIISDFNIGLECAKVSLLGSILNLEANEKMFGKESKFTDLFKKSLKKWR
ncbi:MAG: cyclodeaminase/cyclohydrolase family protein [Candidatus Omnitrophica bacterium]|nr:cyclodeaminase/cyclohydrolase family protein [Candidatus Omnitrophota bacterium]